MRHPENLPDKETAGYQLLELVAISGELPADQLRRLPGGYAYKLNVVRALKSKKLLRTYYRNGLRGYRLTSSAKEALDIFRKGSTLVGKPRPFFFFLDRCV